MARGGGRNACLLYMCSCTWHVRKAYLEGKCEPRGAAVLPSGDVRYTIWESLEEFGNETEFGNEGSPTESEKLQGSDSQLTRKTANDAPEFPRPRPARRCIG
jgi:hypothetical protein